MNNIEVTKNSNHENETTFQSIVEATTNEGDKNIEDFTTAEIFLKQDTDLKKTMNYCRSIWDHNSRNSYNTPLLTSEDNAQE